MLQEICKRKEILSQTVFERRSFEISSRSAGSQVNHERQKGNDFVCILFQSYFTSLITLYYNIVPL